MRFTDVRTYARMYICICDNLTFSAVTFFNLYVKDHKELYYHFITTFYVAVIKAVLIH